MLESNIHYCCCTLRTPTTYSLLQQSCTPLICVLSRERGRGKLSFKWGSGLELKRTKNAIIYYIEEIYRSARTHTPPLQENAPMADFLFAVTDSFFPLSLISSLSRLARSTQTKQRQLSPVGHQSSASEPRTVQVGNPEFLQIQHCCDLVRAFV